VSQINLRNALLLFSVVGMLAGCSTTNSTNSSVSPSSSATASTNSGQKKPMVVVTTDVLCDITKQVAQDTVDLKCLLKAGSDPHVYQSTPADRQAIEKADLVLYAGYDFEPTLIKSIKATNSKSPKVAVNELAVTKPLTMAAEHGAEHDHAGEKAKGKTEEKKADQSESDPHVWHDAKNGIAIAKTIQSKLTAVLPANTSTYEKNTKDLVNQLEKIDSWIKAQVVTIPAKARRLVTIHDALGYYGHAYGLPIEGALQGFSTEEKPTAKRIKELVEDIKKTSVPVVFVEANTSSKLLTSVAQEAQVKVSKAPIFADGLGEPGSKGDTYPKMLMANTQTIVEGLGGKFQPLSSVTATEPAPK
jgi:manganese/iron transport system substrate-binding protein